MMFASRFPVQALLLASAASAAAAQPGIPIPPTPAIVQSGDPGVADKNVRATVLPGTATMPTTPQTYTPQTKSGDVSVNFPDADAAVVAQAVLGDILHKRFVMAQGVAGKVSLVTPQPVSRGSLFELFEAALRRGNLALVPVAGGYEIQNAATARGLIAPGAPGFGSEIITLRFINTEEVRKVLDSVLPGVVTATDPASGAITIAGTTGQRGSARDILRQFDVDWLRNTSFALYVPQRTDARLIVPALEKLINAADSPTHGMVRLIAMEQLNGIIAISTQPAYLRDIQRWVEVLDREGESNERRIFVYRVQNGRARDLVRTINAAFGITTASGASSDPFADASQDKSQYTTQSIAPPPPAATRTAPAAPKDKIDSSSSSSTAIAAHVTADENNNALIVLGTPREYAVIEDALRKLDLPPQQVLIEAAITEVALTDDLNYGVEWNFQSGGTNGGYTDNVLGTVSRLYPGFSFFYGGSSISAAINALQKHTDVKIVSAPKLLVLNNQTAALQVGNQVPISTGSATNLVGSTNSVVSTIEYRDTGVILKITPRVNANGMVQLDVSQEVSEVSGASFSAATQQQSPTISTRRIATTVSVRDGEVIALGGLFSTSNTIGKNGIPFLSQIPVVGGLFGTHTNNEKRTELIVLLKPHVISTSDDARRVTEELRNKLRTLEPFKSSGRIP
jgi:general secretion pathway protein D